MMQSFDQYIFLIDNGALLEEHKYEKAEQMDNLSRPIQEWKKI